MQLARGSTVSVRGKAGSQSQVSGTLNSELLAMALRPGAPTDCCALGQMLGTQT